jgi:oligopeptide/dipeptide ABC transporter ATP-binding protein
VSEPLLAVENLRVHFPGRKSLFRQGPAIRAVDGVSFTVAASEVVGLVGESGCGKTTIGRAILRLIEPTAGAVRFAGRDILGLSAGEMMALRSRMQIIFQDPYASLNPRMTVRDMLAEALHLHGMGRRAERPQRIRSLLDKVGLPASAMERYPYEFSGGQRQRIGIARALAVGPAFIVADEPVSALDVSIQAQIINLLQDLQQEMGLAILFIGHDLSVIEYISDRVIVLYLGHVMEVAPAAALYTAPRHPYTRALLDAVPIPSPRAKRARIVLKGDLPSPANPPSGCVFRGRCPYALPACAEAVPPLRPVGPAHVVACIREDIDLRRAAAV